eukprot:CAMPEP_0115234152 /NCGR_PEP_ID=MMETSP0270-20121206/34645_1 /TAXON_ID=71861 /ORGANISM="Scrippsiella trochoidea, Strain CCMP3099" /LENGTH=423 /DNA_ID=CAMNT_0002648889 /DNA_START=45 /DNA_END=1316 /DNA_ORIENTATION=+
MAPVQSKAVEDEGKAGPALWEKKKRDAFVSTALAHTFQSVAQHVLLIQSELMLVRNLCGDDMAQTARYLANTQGLVGMLGLIVNQAGGKLSDYMGRKPFLMLGPLCNMICGLLVYKNPMDKVIVLACRVIRMIVTTFSNTIMVQAASTDVLDPTEQAVAGAKLGAAIGAGIVLTPFLETALLRRTGNPKFTYLLLSGIAGLQAVFAAARFPETLQRAKEGAISWLSLLNPFAFTSIYTRGSRALKGLVSIVTMQQLIDGKNVSDVTEIWKRNHLNWSIEGSRNFIVLYGTLVIISGAKIGPELVKRMTNRGYTSFTNMTNTLGFFMRGATDKSWLFLLATLPMLPGVNGNSARKLQVRVSKLATDEGFSNGEFSAWLNNLRALTSTVTPIVVGNQDWGLPWHRLLAPWFVGRRGAGADDSLYE